MIEQQQQQIDCQRLQQMQNNVDEMNQAITNEYKQNNNSNSQQLGMKRVKQLHRYLPYSFLPYRNNSLNNNNIITLYPGHTKSLIKQLNSLIYDRQRLSIQRQLMYSRGCCLGEEVIGDQLLQSIIKESGQYQKGFVNKKGNMSVIVGGLLVYVDNNVVYCVRVPTIKDNDNDNRCIQLYEQCVNTFKVYEFPVGSVILGMQLLCYDQFNNNNNNNNRRNNNNNTNNPVILLTIRLCRQLCILNLYQQRIVSTIDSSNIKLQHQHQHNITNRSSQYVYCQRSSSYNTNSINMQTVIYDGVDSIIGSIHYNNTAAINMNMNRQLYFNSNTIKIPNTLINGITRLNTKQLLLSSYDGLMIYDSRQSIITTKLLYSLIQNNNISNSNYHNQRIYSSQRITSTHTYSPYLATCHTRHICLFDIRKLNQPIEKRLHHCQQVPPEIMSYYDGNVQGERLEKGVLVCWSGGSKGQSVMIGVDGQKGFYDRENINGDQIMGKYFQLIPGNCTINTLNNNNNNNNTLNKNYKSASFIRSISLNNYSSTSLAVFTTTNQGAINMHLYNHNSNKQRYQPQQINLLSVNNKQLYQQSNIVNINTKTNSNSIFTNTFINDNTDMFNADYRWMLGILVEKYFSKNSDYVVEQQDGGRDVQFLSNKKLGKQNIKSIKKGNKTSSQRSVSNSNKHQPLLTTTNNNNSKNNMSKKKTSKKKSNHQKSNSNNNNNSQMMHDQYQQLLTDGQYKDQQHCELTYTKRKLNFINLTTFYQTLTQKLSYLLKQQSKHMQQQQQQKYIQHYKQQHTNNISTNQLQLSLTSTQPYSDTYNNSLSQSYENDQLGVNALSLSMMYNNNNKLITNSIIDRLKQQWY